MKSEKPDTDELFRAMEWEALTAPEADESGLPYATHRGTLVIMGCELECFQLSNGQRVFSEESIVRFFSEPSR